MISYVYAVWFYNNCKLSSDSKYVILNLDDIKANLSYEISCDTMETAKKYIKNVIGIREANKQNLFNKQQIDVPEWEEHIYLFEDEEKVKHAYVARKEYILTQEDVNDE